MRFAYERSSSTDTAWEESGNVVNGVFRSSLRVSARVVIVDLI